MVIFPTICIPNYTETLWYSSSHEVDLQNRSTSKLLYFIKLVWKLVMIKLGQQFKNDIHFSHNLHIFLHCGTQVVMRCTVRIDKNYYISNSICGFIVIYRLCLASCRPPKCWELKISCLKFDYFGLEIQSTMILLHFQIGTYTIALCAKMLNKPVYVLCESFKFVRMYPLNQQDLQSQFKVYYK